TGSERCSHARGRRDCAFCRCSQRPLPGLAQLAVNSKSGVKRVNKQFTFTNFRFALLGTAVLALSPFTSSAEPGSDLAGRLKAKQDGSTFVRLRMETGAEKQILQLQIKSRVSGGSADIVYQVLFPKERKGESVLLHRSGEKSGGTLFTPLNNTR